MNTPCRILPRHRTQHTGTIYCHECNIHQQCDSV